MSRFLYMFVRRLMNGCLSYSFSRYHIVTTTQGPSTIIDFIIQTIMTRFQLFTLLFVYLIEKWNFYFHMSKFFCNFAVEIEIWNNLIPKWRLARRLNIRLQTH